MVRPNSITSMPGDDEDQNNPDTWSTLMLDDTFDPSAREAQEYMRDFCDSFFDQDFASKVVPNFQCPINAFDSWLQAQSSFTQNKNGTLPDAIYEQHCRSDATGLPMDPDSFHGCLTAWAEQEEELYILSREGVVQIVYFPFASRVRCDSPNSQLDDEWDLTEEWFKEVQSTMTPVEANKAYFTSFDYWWYDTNQSMFQTAMGSAAIAISASAAIIAFSSRSLIMTLFSVISVAYVLASVTAMMVAFGWRLGFLESICFAILIGISVDFVIHFSHAYTSLPGTVSKEKRTKHALVYMGPSILAAAVTTVDGALIMFACTITFFTRFAQILFFAIVQSLLGSFVGFLTMTDSIGPSAPTYFFDKLEEKCSRQDDDSIRTSEHGGDEDKGGNISDPTKGSTEAAQATATNQPALLWPPDMSLVSDEISV